MRKVVLTSVRFRRKLSELAKNEYTFDKEIIICNVGNFFDEDNQFFKDTKVNEKFLEYPISEIGLYFKNTERGTMCLVALESDGKLGKMSSSVGGICDVDSDEKYYIDLGDPIPTVGLEGEPIKTFELRSDYPMFSQELSKLFDYSAEIAAELQVDYSDASTFEPLKGWKYKSIMLNNNVHEALFRFRDLDLDELLTDLKNNGYTLESIGLIDVRSITDSVTVCMFKNQYGYSYISFFYGIEEEEFMVRIQSSNIELRRVKVNGKFVPMVRVSLSNNDEATTLIHGFDFENFKEYNLAF